MHIAVSPTGRWSLADLRPVFRLLTEHALRRGSHKGSRDLRNAICEYLAAHNESPKPFKWTKSADEILASIARFATRTAHAHAEP